MEPDLLSKFSSIEADALVGSIYFVRLWTPSYGATSDLDYHTKGVALVDNGPA